MRPFDSVRQSRTARVAASLPAPASELTRPLRRHWHRGPVDWDVPTILRRRAAQRVTDSNA
jgi:hypothetical protein